MPARILIRFSAKTILERTRNTRNRESALKLVMLRMRRQRPQGLRQGACRHPVLQGHTAHIRLHQPGNRNVRFLQFLAHKFLCLGCAAFTPRSDRHIAPQHLGEHIIGL